MTGHELTRLLRDGVIERMLINIAKRYSRNMETREEYAQEGLLRIAKMEPGLELSEYVEEGGNEMRRVYQRQLYRVRKKTGGFPNGISRELPPDAVHLYHNKWVRTRAEIDYGWYYPGEWLEYGLTETDARRMSFYEIIVVE